MVVSDEEVRIYEAALARKIKSLRDERGLKRSWVAERLGVHYNTLKNWELGLARPGTRELLALAKLYGVKPYDFYRDLDLEACGCGRVTTTSYDKAAYKMRAS